jgi:hypothetical protein
MSSTAPRPSLSLGAKLLIALTLIIAGAAAATWGLARSDRAARLLGVAPVIVPAPQQLTQITPSITAPALAPDAAQARVAELEARLARVENATQRAEGSAGRADALVVAFAARRAIDRGVQLGFLEGLLVDRFGPQHPRAVATIVTSSRTPVRLDDLVADYARLAPELRSGGPEESWWTGIQRELGSLIYVHRADRPSARPDARYQRAQESLQAGEVDAALAETMRLPGAQRAAPWVDKARRYVAAHRALDEIESSALLAGNAPSR